MTATTRVIAPSATHQYGETVWVEFEDQYGTIRSDYGFSDWAGDLGVAVEMQDGTTVHAAHAQIHHNQPEA